MKYPLEQLAVIKQKKLEEAERILQEKKATLAKEQEKLKGIEKERDSVKEHKEAKLTQFRQTLDEGTTSDKIQQMKEYLKVVEEQLKQKEHKVKEQLKKVTEAEKQVEAARVDLVEKQQDVEKLKIHREEWEKEKRQIEEHEEAVESDEIGSAMHLLRKREKDRQSRKKNSHKK